MSEPNRFFKFDPTIHAGHIMTAATIAICTIGAWYDLRADVNELKVRAAEAQHQIEAQAKRNDEQDAHWQDKMELMNTSNHAELVKMRDDMNGWFMRLSDKLDTKADKRGN